MMDSRSRLFLNFLLHNPGFRNHTVTLFNKFVKKR